MALPSLPNGSIAPMQLRYHWTPIASVVPFTYRDGWTMLRLIEEFRKYITETFHPDLVRWVSEELDQIKKNIDDLAGELVEKIDVEFDKLTDQQAQFVTQINNLVTATNNKTGPTDVQHYTLTEDYELVIDPTWTTNHIIFIEVAQDDVGGHAFTLPASVTGRYWVKTGANQVTRLRLFPNGDGTYSVSDENSVPMWDNLIRAGVGAMSAMPEGYRPDGDDSSVALGRMAMGNMKSPESSIAIGNNAMRSSTKSLDNTAIGTSALRSVELADNRGGGSRNIAIGGNAGRFTVTGSANTFVGRNAGQHIQSGVGAVAIGNGAQAGRCPVGLSGTVENWAPSQTLEGSNSNIVAVGNWALSKNLNYDNTGVGAYALASNVKSKANVALGANSLRRLDEKRWLDGSIAESVSKSGTYTQDGYSLVLTFPEGHNAAAGDIIGIRLLDGPSQTHGADEVYARVNGINSSIQLNCVVPQNKTGSGAATLLTVAKAGTSETGFGYANTAGGSASLAWLQEGYSNTAFGKDAGLMIKSGQNNTFIGTSSVGGASGTIDKLSETTAVGQGTLFALKQGGEKGIDGNTALGYRAGLTLMDGWRNTLIGRMAGTSTPGGATVNSTFNSTAIGADAPLSGDSQVQLGNSATTTYVYGTVQNRSDVRDKADVRDTVLGLDFINSVRPVDFRWDMRDDYEGGVRDGSKKRNRFHHGVIAQEVSELGEFGGVQHHAVNGGEDVYTVGYDEFIAPLIKAVQELTARVKELEDK